MNNSYSNRTDNLVSYAPQNYPEKAKAQARKNLGCPLENATTEPMFLLKTCYNPSAVSINANSNSVVNYPYGDVTGYSLLAVQGLASFNSRGLLIEQFAPTDTYIAVRWRNVATTAQTIPTTSYVKLIFVKSELIESRDVAPLMLDMSGN